MVGRHGLGRPTRVAVRRGVVFGGIEEDEMETTARTTAMRRRCVAIGLAAILATAALLPSAVSADHRAPAAPASLPRRRLTPGRTRPPRITHPAMRATAARRPRITPTVSRSAPSPRSRRSSTQGWSPPATAARRRADWWGAPSRLPRAPAFPAAKGPRQPRP